MSFTLFTDASPWITPMGEFFAAVIFLLFLAVLTTTLPDRKRMKQKKALKTWVFESSYTQAVLRLYPHLCEEDIQLAFEQLRIYFYVCWNQEAKQVAMPSKLVDVSWHVFILDTRAYLKFCEAVFDRYLHHEPPAEVALEDLTQEKEQRIQWLPIVRAYQGARYCEAKWQAGVADTNNTLLAIKNASKESELIPMLFLIDSTLQVADGFRYSADFLKFLAEFDLRSAESAAAKQDGTGSGLAAGCGDGGACGCGGST
jgi:hypothetical protein